jgi:hypothetical protein
MMITRKSGFTGVERTLDIPVTEEQLVLWNSGVVIQKAMPNLTPDQREFLMTGVTPEEWDETFDEDDTVDSTGIID